MIKSYEFKDGGWEETKDGTENGPYKIFYKSGNLEEEGIYINGKKQGRYIMYYETGEVLQSGSYKHGEFDGIYKSFHKNGNLKEFGGFKSDEADGILEHYNSRGQLKNQFYINKGEPVHRCTQYDYANNTISWHEVKRVNRVTFKPGAALCPGMDPDTVLPDILDYYIYDIAGGVYKIYGENYNQDTITVVEYLGTYFPKTFMESQSIFFEIFKSEKIREVFNNKKK